MKSSHWIMAVVWMALMIADSSAKIIIRTNTDADPATFEIISDQGGSEKILTTRDFDYQNGISTVLLLGYDQNASGVLVALEMSAFEMRLIRLDAQMNCVSDVALIDGSLLSDMRWGNKNISLKSPDLIIIDRKNAEPWKWVLRDNKLCWEDGREVPMTYVNDADTVKAAKRFRALVREKNAQDQTVKGVETHGNMKKQDGTQVAEVASKPATRSESRNDTRENFSWKIAALATAGVVCLFSYLIARRKSKSEIPPH